MILETKWNTLLNKIASLVNVPGQHGIVQADGRLDVWSRRQVVKCAVLLDWSCSCSTASSSRCSTRRSSGSSSSSSSSSINIGGRRGAAVAAASAATDVLSGSCSYGISRRSCYTRIYSIQSQGKPWLLLGAAAGGGCGNSRAGGAGGGAGIVTFDVHRL